MSLIGSRAVENQLRRRLAIEVDGELDRSATAPSRATNRAANESDSPSPFVADLAQWIPATLWKLWTVGLGIGLVLVGLSFVWLSIERATLVGSPVADSLLPLVDQLNRGAGTFAWLGAAQMSAAIWWMRSRSQQDFAGKFHVWGWTSLSFAILGLTQLTDLHQALAQGAAALLIGSGRASPVVLTAMWLLPSLVAGMVTWTNLSLEFRSHLASRLLHSGVGVCGLSLVGLELAELIVGNSLSLEFVSRLVLAMCQWSAAMSVLLHVQYVAHQSCDPPEASPSAWFLVWHHGPGRLLRWQQAQRQLRQEQRTEEAQFEEAISASGGKRYVQIDDQDVRIDAAEDLPKGPTARNRQRVRR